MYSRPYKRYVLSVLTLVYTLNFIDQGLIALLIQPIKEDLGFSDSQLGLLTGIAFALFYAVLGLPIARWADRGNRVTITSLAIGLWGVTVMLCLLVTNFAQLLAARIAAAVGESGCMPPTYSLLGDYFPAPADRTRAMSIYNLANPLSLIVSFLLGGWLNEHYGWRVAFFVMGIPALLVAMLVKATVKETREQPRDAYLSTRPAVPMRRVLVVLWRQNASRNITLAIIFLVTMGQGIGPWYAAFLMRSHGMGTAELGVWFAAIFGLAGIVGVGAGGYVTSRCFSGNERNQLRLTAVVTLMLVPFLVLFLLVPQKWQALAALAPLQAALCFFLGPTFALLQRLVVDEVRATVMATIMLLANLIGMGAGPQIVGVFSDRLASMLGNDSLRYAMSVVSLAGLMAAYHFWRAGQTVKRDLSSVRKS